MGLKTYNIELVEGEDLAITVARTQQPSGLPVDCTGADYSAAISTRAGGPVLATFTVVWTSRPLGQAVLKLTQAQTAAIPAGVHGWDLFFTDSLGARTRQLTGSVTKSLSHTPAP